MWPCVNETSPQPLWPDLVIYPLDPVTEGLRCSVNCVFDTTSQVFRRDSLSTYERLVHCKKTIAFVVLDNRGLRKGIHVPVVLIVKMHYILYNPLFDSSDILTAEGKQASC